jgi:hypothetical protein
VGATECVAGRAADGDQSDVRLTDIRVDSLAAPEQGSSLGGWCSALLRVFRWARDATKAIDTPLDHRLLRDTLLTEFVWSRRIDCVTLEVSISSPRGHAHHSAPSEEERNMITVVSEMARRWRVDAYLVRLTDICAELPRVRRTAQGQCKELSSNS